ncbi:ADP,ATP carrier protein, mitochondrial-like isoform X2 [Salvia miltiorrhiza]|uniref:ADP,ATP carrier protein, mitochondrial-like isoform X2 n=1 Tax=Salvia miltiorrhiza TaxID=226208 RepID=UPI0025AC4D89|nr:ADP,ATP carrier protein, mitochondrial-like isoform X2 [Salvia miltiorrhiza]
MSMSQHSGASVVKSDGFVQDKRFVGLSYLTGVAVCKTATAPFDRVKLLMQNEGAIVMSGRLSAPYKGIRNCLWRTVMEEGVASLWRGNTLNVIRYLPSQALTFGMWDFYKSKIISRGDSKDTVGLLGWHAMNVAAGVLAGSSSILFVHPMDYVRTRLAMDVKMGGARQFKGSLDLCKKTLAADGVVGFYCGFTQSFMGAAVYRGLYFGMYETLKPFVLTGEMQDSFFGRFGVAWVSAIFAGSASYAPDISRRGMMMMSGKFKSCVAALEHVRLPVDETGYKAILKSIYKGGGANILRAVVGAAALAAYDKLNAFSISCCDRDRDRDGDGDGDGDGGDF